MFKRIGSNKNDVYLISNVKWLSPTGKTISTMLSQGTEGDVLVLVSDLSRLRSFRIIQFWVRGKGIIYKNHIAGRNIKMETPSAKNKSATKAD